MELTAQARRAPAPVSVLVAAVASAAVVLAAGAGARGWAAVGERPVGFVAFVALTAALQLVSVEVYGRGRYSFSSAGMLATGFVFGIGPALATAALVAAINPLGRRPPLHRAIFDVAQWMLAAGAGAAVFALFAADGWSPAARTGPSLAAAAVFLVVNVGLLSAAMSLSERRPPLELWRERFRWITPYSLAAGPLGLALAVAYAELGLTGLCAFALPPAFMMLSVRQYVARTRAAVEEERRRGDDLRELVELAGGLAARTHDSAAVVAYVEDSLARLTAAEVRVELRASEGAGLELAAGGRTVGHLSVRPSGERWERLRDTIVPQIATALESAQLAERVRRSHRDTIAALSRAMEAKDLSTGGHTERVSSLAVELGRRLGYAGTDLDAIEIGALLHDVGKIGIPERLMHKPGPLDEDEWEVMRRHPVISDYILSEADLHPFVRQIARWSHERLDGAGYPDALAGDEIPLPARIVLVADALDALTSDRPYRRARPPAAALEELRRHTGTQFCPRVVAALEELLEAERASAAA